MRVDEFEILIAEEVTRQASLQVARCQRRLTEAQRNLLDAQTARNHLEDWLRGLRDQYVRRAA